MRGNERPFIGWILIAGSVLGMVILTLRLIEKNPLPSPIFLIGLLALTWVFFGYVVWLDYVTRTEVAEKINAATAPLLAQLEAAHQTANRQPSTNGSPLRDPAKKWSMARDIVAAASKGGDKCTPHIQHYTTPYSETFSDDLMQVFEAAQWERYQYVAAVQLSRGIVFRASDEIGKKCAEMVRGAIGVDVPALQKVPDPGPTDLDWFTRCAGCFQIRIGNEPEK